MSMAGLIQMIRAQRRIKKEEERVKFEKQQFDLEKEKIKIHGPVWSGTRQYDLSKKSHLEKKKGKCDATIHEKTAEKKETPKSTKTKKPNSNSATTCKSKKVKKKVNNTNKTGVKGNKTIKQTISNPKTKKRQKSKSKTRTNTKTTNIRVDTSTMIERYLGSPLQDRQNISPEIGWGESVEAFKSCASTPRKDNAGINIHSMFSYIIIYAIFSICNLL